MFKSMQKKLQRKWQSKRLCDCGKFQLHPPLEWMPLLGGGGELTPNGSEPQNLFPSLPNGGGSSGNGGGSFGNGDRSSGNGGELPPSLRLPPNGGGSSGNGDRSSGNGGSFGNGDRSSGNGESFGNGDRSSGNGGGFPLGVRPDTPGRETYVPPQRQEETPTLRVPTKPPLTLRPGGQWLGTPGYNQPTKRGVRGTDEPLGPVMGTTACPPGYEKLPQNPRCTPIPKHTRPEQTTEANRPDVTLRAMPSKPVALAPSTMVYWNPQGNSSDWPDIK